MGLLNVKLTDKDELMIGFIIELSKIQYTIINLTEIEI